MDNSILKPGSILQRGKFQIIKSLGQGGFGNTYQAVDTTQQIVAIKELFVKDINYRVGSEVMISNAQNAVLYERIKTKFLKEAQRISMLNSPHFVNIHDIFEENSTVYYVMDYIDGKSLKDLNIEEADILSLFYQILEALQVIHHLNLWHLDIKPENIMLSNDGIIKLIDFGASKHVIPDSSQFTTSSIVAFTNRYAAPELSEGLLNNLGPWTDFYSLGATIYSISTHKIPPTSSEIISEGVNAFDFSNLKGELVPYIVKLLMNPNRHNRPVSCEQLLSLFGDNELTRNMTHESKGLLVNNFEAIDLGLSVLWASKDIGASNIYDSGRRYLWGDPDGNKTERAHSSRLAYLFTRGPFPNNISGNYKYDTSTNILGSPWRMPLKKDFTELINDCKWEMINDTFVRVTGPNGNSVILNDQSHWLGECMMRRMLYFKWAWDGNNITCYLPMVNGDYVDNILPIRPVIDRNYLK